MHIIRLLLISIFLLTHLMLHGSEDRYYFKQISVKDGISQSTIRAIALDYKGYLWIGTQKGLNRYDGKEITQYLYNTGANNSLTGNHIFFIHEDKNKTLWIGTDSSVVIYNRTLNTFQSLPQPYCNDNYRSVIERGDSLLFVRYDQLLCYNKVTGVYRIIPILPQNKQNFSPALKAQIFSDNKLLIAFRWQGLYECDLTTGVLRRCDFYPYNDAIDLYVDKNKNIWCSSHGRGVVKYNTATTQLKEYNTHNSALNNDVIFAINSFEDNEIWLCTDGGGINILNTESDKIRIIKNNPEDNYSIPVNSTNLLYRDPKGNRWIGTIRGGVLGMKRNYMRTFNNAYPFSPYGLSQTTVNSITEDTNGDIWIATDGEGVNRFDPKTNHFKHYATTFGKKITSIELWDRETLIINVFREGLLLMNKQTGALRATPITTALFSMQSRANISISLYNISPTQLALFTDTLMIYNKVKRQMEPVKGFNHARNGVLYFMKAEAGRLYFYSQEQVLVFESVAGVLTQQERLTIPLLSTINSAALYQDKIWIGNNNGLYCFDLAQKVVTKVGTFPNFVIDIVETDLEGRVWIGAIGQLYCYLPDKKQYFCFNETDGIAPNEFLSKSKLATSDGDLYLGGVAGLLRVNTHLPYEITPIFTPVISEVFVDGQSIDENEYGKGSLKLSPNYSTFTLRITAKDGNIGDNVDCRYMLKGCDDKFITTSHPLISYNDLPPGNYELFISSPQESDEAQPKSLLKIVVLPHWWQTWWFFLLAILFISVVFFFIWRNMSLRQKRQIERHRVVLERENYEYKVRFLININHELRTPLTLITLPLSRLLAKKQQLDPDIFNVLSRINKQAKVMKSVIDTVLDIRKAEVTQEKITPTQTDINEWVRGHIETFEEEFKAVDITLSFHPIVPPVELYFDHAKCNKVISNLFINTLKFSPSHTTVNVFVTQTDGYVRVSIADEGMGISEPDKLFQRFYQGNHDKGGSGIGLSYSKILVEMHGGKMGAYNNPDKGATFYFELPISTSSSDLRSIPQPIQLTPEPTPQPTPSILHNTNQGLAQEEWINVATAIDLHRYVILVVEDETELRETLRETFVPLFHAVLTAADGDEALALCATHTVSIIVSDVMMPHKDGFELCRIIKEQTATSHIPIILLTARSNHESKLAGYRYGADGYVTKPFDMDILLQRIQNILQLRTQLSRRILERGVLSITENETTITSNDKQFLEKLDAFITAHIDSSTLDVEAIALHMAMSRSSLYAKVKSLLDIGLKEYINTHRLNTAKTLLRETDLSVSEISDRIGYSRQGYFSAAFKQATGVSPLQYRAQEQH